MLNFVISYLIVGTFNSACKNLLVIYHGAGWKAMANYPQELAQDALCQSRTGHMTGLWFLPARPLRLSTNE